MKRLRLGRAMWRTENHNPRRHGIVRLPLVQQIPKHASDDENWNRYHKNLERINQNRAPAKPLIASLIQDRRL